MSERHELPKTYDPHTTEDRLYKFWEENGYFHAEIDENKTPYTIMLPPPNVTGQLHMGHAFDDTLQDILIRYRRMQGYWFARPMQPEELEHHLLSGDYNLFE